MLNRIIKSPKVSIKSPSRTNANQSKVCCHINLKKIPLTAKSESYKIRLKCKSEFLVTRFNFGCIWLTIFKIYNKKRKEGCEKCEFLVHEVYALDVLVSTGEGKPKEGDVRTTVYKKKDIIYQLKMKTSRAFLSEAEKKFSLMPFTLR